ncbi:ABC transporter ATP-binding protein [Intestinibacter bartlettii]|uniref:ABC transporter ATP-binding protein n=1 Tax=Intestinibacter bartlettii TaxID=261299 RepID=UPI001D117DAB|nr:ABC transporter ATP-binding protein [Intestinibacter bartlettii]MCC2706071.1 ATP-binding cassette domain-containing protein [Intestinibacter bartlettii]MCC2761521.1 ATP-binding cassette domain-containing protein [Intestinibacter bartlettii]
MEILRVDGLKFSYPNQLKKALNNINFSIDEGDFVLICGESGCGKSTLLRHLKPELSPHGQVSGDIYYYSQKINDYTSKQIASEIGYVLQNPDSQIVTDKVWHELAFGLENMGLDTQSIRLRVAEMASFFGIQGWFRKNVNDLSGGQKQLLNLASIMAMQPKILILDEPTSQLDPIAAKDFIDTLVRINKELSTTIIMTEHNLEDIYSVCDKVIVMEDGKVICNDTNYKVVDILSGDKNHKMFKSLPTSSKIYNQLNGYLEGANKSPLTVKDCRQWLNDSMDEVTITKLDDSETEINIDEKDREIAIELKDVYFQYNKISEPTIRDLSFKVYKGEIYSILGGNGTGKSTTLSLVARQRKPQRGKIFINNIEMKKYNNKSLYENNLALLPQNPQSLFVFETVREDLEEVLILKNKDREYIDKEVKRVSKLLDIEHLLEHHPYDLSGGELQRAGMAKVMLLNPKIILLDEPTKGLDAYCKEEIGKMLMKLRDMGVTIVVVSHDIEFSARYSDRCAMFFDGSIVSEGTPREFFLGNNFYTTVSNRIARNIFEDTLIYEDVVSLCKKNIELKTKISS